MIGQFNMDVREIRLDRTHTADELVKLAFHTLQASTHLAQNRQHEVVRLVSHGPFKVRRDDCGVNVAPDSAGVCREADRPRRAGACRNGATSARGSELRSGFLRRRSSMNCTKLRTRTGR